MKIYIIIPAHNEETYLAETLNSLVKQTLLPTKIVVVDDNSTDSTFQIANDFAERYDFISVLKNNSSEAHLPGGKVINAFYKGYETLDEDYDVICKFDADLIFPSNYLEQISTIFETEKNVGICSGLCYVEKNGSWVYENIADKDHVRGPIKSYSKECFKVIGGLKKSIGWDTLDVLLAQYQGFEVKTDESLIVKHLKPTGKKYQPKAKLMQGEAMYKMRYGFNITFIAALKMSVLKKDPKVLSLYVMGFLKAKKEKQPFLVSEKEGAFIRSLRWKKIREKLF